MCRKHYQNPKTLTCLHSFCLACIQSICTSESKVCCPECKKEIRLQSSDCTELQDAYYINRRMKVYEFLQKVHRQIDTTCEKCAERSVKAQSYCSDCGKFICELCVKIHKSWSEFQGHTVLTLEQLKSCYERYIPDNVWVLPCVIHTKDCTVYCETCEEMICHECIIKGHREHQYLLTSDAAKNHRARIVQKLETITSIPEQLEGSIDTLEGICDGLTEKGRAITARINEKFEEMEEVLEHRRASLLAEIDRLVTTKSQLLNHQKDGLDILYEKAASCIEFIEHTTSDKHISEFLLLEHIMSARITEVKREFSGTDLTPVEVPEVHFSLEPQAMRELRSCGSVSEGSILYAGTKDSKVYEVNEMLTFYIALSSMYYKSRSDPSKELKAEIKSFRDGSICPAMVAVSSSGFAKLQCSFSERGRYAVVVKVSGHQITGSPFEFFIRPASTQFQTPVRVLSKMNSSKGVAVNAKNQIVITEENSNSVSVYGKTKKILTIGVEGETEGELNCPIGVTTDKDGYIYVADSKNNRVQKFDSDGNFAADFTGEKTPCGELNSPTGVKLDGLGQLFVVDKGNSRIIVLTSELKYVSIFGSPRVGMGQLVAPWDVAFDKHGFVYVTDMNRHCIQIYSHEGEFRGKIGSEGTQKGYLNRPSGIAIDQFGLIYVCEFGNHRVSVFHVGSECVDCFSTGLSMVNPCGIAIDSDGYIYVSSTEVVQVF